MASGASVDPIITGFVAPDTTSPAIRYIVNNSVDTLYLERESASSAASNRIRFSVALNGNRLAVKSFEICTLVYVRSQSRWYASLPGDNGALSTAITLTGGTTTNNRNTTTVEDRSSVWSIGSTSGTATLSGMQPTVFDKFVSGPKVIELTGSVTFLHESASSTAENRFSITGASDWVGVSGDRAYITYSPSPGSQRWVIHPIKPPGAGGGGGFTEAESTATVSGTNNDYSPSGWQDATSVILTGVGTVTGFAAPNSGKPRFKRIVVVDNASAVTFSHMNTGSVSANRIEMPNPYSGGSLNFDTRLVTGCSMWIAYNTANARWQAMLPSPMDSYQAPTFYVTGATSLGLGESRGYDNMVMEGFGAGPYVLNGIIAPTSTTALSRTSLKMVRFNSAITITHEAGSIPSANRITLTGGASWLTAVGDIAIMSYDATLARWIMHPCRSSASPAPGTTSATARTLSTTTVQTWTGSSSPVFTYSSGTARASTETIFFPASSLASITLSSDLDPTGTVAYTFDDSLAAYVLQLQYFEIGPCIVATMRKVTDLVP
jgi:hypothetical protein